MLVSGMGAGWKTCIVAALVLTAGLVLVSSGVAADFKMGVIDLQVVLEGKSG